MGTQKLESVFEELLLGNKLNEYERFYCTFLYSDLRLKQYMRFLEKFAKIVRLKTLKDAAFLKLMMYFSFRDLHESQKQDMVNIIAEMTAGNISKKPTHIMMGRRRVRANLTVDKKRFLVKLRQIEQKVDKRYIEEV
jgi:hypothetical protein